MEPTSFRDIDWTFIEEATQDDAGNITRWWTRTPHVMDIPIFDSEFNGLTLPDIETIFGTSASDTEELDDDTIADNQMSWEDMMQLQGEEDEK